MGCTNCNGTGIVNKRIAEDMVDEVPCLECSLKQAVENAMGREPNRSDKIKAITLDQIQSVYSGRPGCMCGCRGKHRFASQHVAAASKSRGYEVTADEINDRQVKKVFNLLQQHADDPKIELDEGDYIYCEIDGRAYAAYVR